jgi:hypothetical protein
MGALRSMISSWLIPMLVKEFLGEHATVSGIEETAPKKRFKRKKEK